MTTKDTKFIYDNGFIPLQDLEALYAKGFLKLEDSVTVIDKERQAESSTINDLIKLHGVQFPFRRGNTPAVTGVLDDCVYTNLQLLEEWKNGPKVEIRLPEDVRIDLRKAVVVDWPLFNLENEPEEDRITGGRVLEEMKYLKRKMVQARNRPETFASFFSFLDKKPNDNEQARCRLCDYSPPSAELFFKHLFRFYHINCLHKEQVSKRSFDFWSDKFDQCFSECVKHDLQDTLSKKPIALETEKTYTKIRLLSLRHLKTQCPELTEKVKLLWIEEEVDECQKKRRKALNKLSRLRALSKTVSAHVSWSRLPLFTKELEIRDNLITGEEIYEEMEKLKAAFPVAFWTPERTEFFRFVSDQFYPLKPPYLKTCMICYVDTTTPKDFFGHMFSKKHISKLSGLTIPRISFEVWMEQFEQCERECGKKCDDAPSGAQSFAPRSVLLQQRSFRKPKEKTKPRIPLLDPLRVDSTENLKLSPDDVHCIYSRFHSAIEKCTEDQLSQAKIKNIQWTCTQCEGPSVVFISKLYAVYHIFSREHLETIQNATSYWDLEYWSRWLTNLNPQLTNGVFQNIPRIPLLDPLAPDEVSVTKGQTRPCLNKCREILKENPTVLDSAKTWKVDWSCSFCSCFLYTCRFCNKAEVLSHILSAEHQKNMKIRPSKADLQYWLQYLRLLKDPLSGDENESEEDKEIKALKLKNRLNREAIYERPTNTPPIPLLDIILPVLPVIAYRARYAAIDVTNLIPDQNVNQPQICTCYHCPDAPSFKTQWEVIQHHDSFEYYEKLFQNLKRTSRVPNTVQESIPTDPIQNLQNLNPLEAPKTACLLPLFASNHAWRKPTDTVCIGPTREQVALVMKFRKARTLLEENQTLCGTCHLDMSNWLMRDVVKHAFSVEHLNKFRIVGGQFMVEDFDWWMTNWKIEFKGSELHTISNFRLGGFHPIPVSGYISTFRVFHMKQFDNLINSKVSSVNLEILEKFAACVYCNKWLLTGRDVLRHYTSEQHFEMVKKSHPVSQEDIDKIMRYVEECQKDSKCVVM